MNGRTRVRPRRPHGAPRTRLRERPDRRPCWDSEGRSGPEKGALTPGILFPKAKPSHASPRPAPRWAGVMTAHKSLRLSPVLARPRRSVGLGGGEGRFSGTPPRGQPGPVVSEPQTLFPRGRRCPRKCELPSRNTCLLLPLLWLRPLRSVAWALPTAGPLREPPLGSAGTGGQ